MAEEIQEAVQIIRVAYDGIEIAMKVGSGGVAAIQKVLDVLTGLLDYEKSIGKTNMRKLLMKGGDLQVFQFKTSEMKKVEKMAKQYGILYSTLPDVNKADGMSEIVFHSEAVPRVNMMIQKLKFGRIATFEDYLKSSDEKELGKLLNFLQGQKKGNDKIHTDDDVRANLEVDNLIEKVGLFAMEKDKVSVDAVKENFSIGHQEAEDVLKQLETMGVLDKRDANGNHKVLMDKEAFGNRIRGYQDLAERMRAISKSKDMNLADITISKTLIAKESETAIKTRIPGTWGEDVRYIWVRKENIMEIHSGKTILTFLDPKKDYKIYDKENRVVSTMKGQDLYDKHYDKVEATVREHYEKSQKKAPTQKTKTPTHTATQKKR